MADLRPVRKLVNVKTLDNLRRNFRFKMFALYTNDAGASLNDVVPTADEWAFKGSRIIFQRIAYKTYKDAILAFAKRDEYVVKVATSASTTVVPPREPTPSPTGHKRRRSDSVTSDGQPAVRARTAPPLAPIEPADIITFAEGDIIMVNNRANLRLSPKQSSLYLTASENISEDNSWEDGGAYEMWTPETRRARIDELRVIVVDIPSMYAWIQESPVFALRRDLACIDEFLENGASSAYATILGSVRFFVDRELYARERAITAAPASGGSGGMGDSGADNMVKVRNILDTFLNVRVTIDKDDMPDLYPDTSFAKRQPLAILRQDNFEALDAAIDGKVMCVRSMMQTFKTASQVGFMLLELARGNMVCMLMGSEGGAVDKYTENVRDIIAIIEKECRAPYTICFAKGDDMADAIARHEAGHPVVVIALAHHTQLAKIYDGLAKGCYFDKVAIIIDEVHSKMSPPKTIGGPEHSLRCSYMKELIKGSSRAYLVTATSADVVFNIDDGSFGIPGDQIQYITGPDANWIGWPLYLGIDSLTPFVRTEGSFCRHRYVKETLFGCDASQTAINLTSNMDVLNQVDTERWCPAYRAFIEEADGLQGFVFTRPTYIRNVLINTELVNMIHLKAFDCVTVMIHGTASTNAKANDKFDLVVEPGVKSAYPCIVMWRDPDSAFWTDANVAANATHEAWCAAVQYRAFKSWTDACKDEEVRERVARRMIFMSTNLGGGSVSIVQKTLGRSITHIAVAHMSDYNNVIQMIGRAFHNQPDVRVMCMRHGAADSSEDDRERFVHGKPIVRAFMSAQDIGDLKEYFHLTDEMCANKRRFDTVGGGNALYTRPATAFLRGNEVGLGVAKVMRRVAAHAKLDVGAADAQKEWGEDHCPDHIEAVAVWEEQHEQHEQQGDVTLSLWGEAAARKPSATVLETDMDVVFRFDGVTAEMIDAGAYKWSVSYPITSTARFANGSGTHQPNNCPVHLAHMGGSSYKNIWVIDEVRGCVEIKVLKVERERAREMDGETFTWTRYDSGVWVENTHQAGGECSSEACSRRRRAVVGGERQLSGYEQIKQMVQEHQRTNTPWRGTRSQLQQYAGLTSTLWTKDQLDKLEKEGYITIERTTVPMQISFVI